MAHPPMNRPSRGKCRFMVTALTPCPAFVIDPKGLMATLLAKRERPQGDGTGQNKKVRVIDPFHLGPDQASAKSNLFDMLRAEKQRSGRIAKNAVKP
jgi:hypothetical protein